MKIKLLTNINCPQVNAFADAEVDVPDDFAKTLIENRFAVAVEVARSVGVSEVEIKSLQSDEHKVMGGKQRRGR